MRSPRPSNVLCKAAFPRVFDLPNRVSTSFTPVGNEAGSHSIPHQDTPTDAQDVLARVVLPQDALSSTAWGGDDARAPQKNVRKYSLTLLY
jgi:hypothetical protein